MKALHLLAALFLVFAAAPAKAELPPQVYVELHQKAGEALKIRVDEVDSKPNGLLDRSSFTETVKATVLEVIRSQSGVKKGDLITIRDERMVPKDGWVDPTPAPQLKAGKEYPAYLGKGDDGTFPSRRGARAFRRWGEGSVMARPWQLGGRPLRLDADLESEGTGGSTPPAWRGHAATTDKICVIIH